MDWPKLRSSTWIILAVIFGSIMWMDSQAKKREWDSRISIAHAKSGSHAHSLKTANERIAELEKEICVIKAVLFMKNIMPAELVIKKEEK